MELVVACGPLSAEEEQYWLSAVAARVKESSEALRNVFGDDGVQFRVGRGARSLLVPLEAWAQWQREYSLPRVGFAVKQITGAASRTEPAAEVDFWTVDTR